MESSRGKGREETLVEGLKQVRQLLSSFALSMALKCAVELGIPDIIHSHATPVSLSQIASGIGSPSVDIANLRRIMRYLAYKNVFTTQKLVEDGDILYGLPENSRWLLKDSDESISAYLLFQFNPWLQVPWHYFGQCIKEGGIPFEKANGCQLFDFASQNPEFNSLFNEGLACMAKNHSRAIIEGYKDGFNQMRSMVDVGGGKAEYLSEIVKAYPHIKGINFDLPHVVATAPSFEGVTHVEGDMFESVPNADAIFMKGVIHDWADEDCLKILKNCRKAIDDKSGKLILVEIVLQREGREDFAELGLEVDLMMFAHTTCGKERTELEFKKLLGEGGFPRYKIIKIPSMFSIIEAYLE